MARVKNLILFCLLFASHSVFSDTFCTITGGAGASYIGGINDGDLKGAINQASANFSFTNADFGGRMIAECSLLSQSKIRNKGFHFDVGVGAIMYGDLTGDVQSSVALTYEDKKAIAHKLMFPSVSYGLIFTPNYYFTKDLIGKLRLGYMFWSDETSVSNEKFKDSGTAIYYGLEMGYSLDEKMDISLAWDSTSKYDVIGNLFSVNLSYKFDLHLF